MTNSKTVKADFISLYHYAIIAILTWTAIIVASLIWNYVHEHRQIEELALKEALTVYHKDLAFRLWATRHGGVYVPVTEDTPSNKYLENIPEQDITTPSGKKLTLMNPAYMIRQVMEDYSKLYGVGGHITSLKLKNPDNSPDEWERRALEHFEDGDKEVAERVSSAENGQLRLMRPMITKEGCLKCHGDQGYEVGDVRGGIAVTVDMAAYYDYMRNNIRAMAVTHGLIWLFGLVAVGFVSQRTKRWLIERKLAEEELRKYGHIISATNDHMSFLDRNYIYQAVNVAYLKAHLKAREDIIGHSVAELLGEDVFEQLVREKLDCCLTGEEIHYRDWFDFAGVGRRYMDVVYYPFREIDESVSGIIVRVHDSTERKRKEELIRAQHNLGWALNTAGGLEDVLRLCVETAIQMSGMDCGGVYLVDDNSGDLKLAFHRGLPQDFVKIAAHYDAGSDSARLIMAGRPVYMNYQKLPVSMDDVRRKEGLRAIAVIPVRCENRVIACLNIASHEFDDIPDSARIALETIVAQIGSAISRKKAEKQLQRHREHLEELVEERTNELAQSLDEMMRQRISIQNMALDLEDTNKRLIGEIKERKQAEQTLRETNLLLETILDNTHMLIACMDQQFNFIRVNRIYAEADEKEPNFFPGRNHFDLYPDAENEEIFRRVIETGEPHFVLAKPFEYEEHLERGVGYWDWSLVPIKDSERFVTGVVLTLVNVTERQRAERDMKLSESKLRSTLTSMDDYVFVFDTESRFVDCFSASKNLLKLPEKFMDKRHSEVMPPDIDKLFVEAFDKNKAGYVADYEYRLDIGGEPCSYSVKLSPMSIDDEFSGSVAVVRDITESKRAADNLEKAKEAAEAANKAKSTFLANMSHELRTPLNAILGFSQLLGHSTNLDSEEQKNLGIIRRSGEHLLNLINDVLDMSKIEAGRTVLSEKDFNVHRLLDDVENMFRLKAEEQGLELVSECDAGVPKYIRTDQGKLRQVLVNLLGNAIKFTESGGVTVRIKKTPEVLKTSEVSLIFEVEDTGPGISPDEQHFRCLRPDRDRTEITGGDRSGTAHKPEIRSTDGR